MGLGSSLSDKFGVLTEGNLNALISDKFAERKEHLKKTEKEYSQKYKELMPTLKETGTKMPKEMEQFEDYVYLVKKVDPSLIHKIEAELHGLQATYPAEFVTTMGSSSVGEMEEIHRWLNTGEKKRDPSMSAKVELLEAFLALLIAIKNENETFFQILASKWHKDVGFY
jgi:hypothetical protein